MFGVLELLEYIQGVDVFFAQNLAMIFQFFKLLLKH